MVGEVIAARSEKPSRVMRVVEKCRELARSARSVVAMVVKVCG